LLSEVMLISFIAEREIVCAGGACGAAGVAGAR
jgi:hypothetical protein